MPEIPQLALEEAEEIAERSFLAGAESMRRRLLVSLRASTNAPAIQSASGHDVCVALIALIGRMECTVSARAGREVVQ